MRQRDDNLATTPASKLRPTCPVWFQGLPYHPRPGPPSTPPGFPQMGFKNGTGVVFLILLATHLVSLPSFQTHFAILGSRRALPALQRAAGRHVPSTASLGESGSTGSPG